MVGGALEVAKSVARARLPYYTNYSDRIAEALYENRENSRYCRRLRFRQDICSPQHH